MLISQTSLIILRSKAHELLQCNYYVSGIKYCAMYTLEDPMCHLGDTLDNAREDNFFKYNFVECITWGILLQICCHFSE